LSSEKKPHVGATSRSRTKGRELALKYLYQADVRKGDSEPFETFAVHQEEGGATVEFARGLVERVLSQRQELDKLLSRFAHNWSLDRMAIIDRNILRIGALELLSEDAPRSVVINEAIELGKRFSTADSGKFINGILDRIGREDANDPADAGKKG
jgi:N utilization substance protein B